jgi:hypothetical protein
MSKVFKNLLPSFLPIALAVTLVCLITYVASQQVYRMSANDPQIQLAEDIGGQLARGNPPQIYIPQFKVDISKSLGTFIMIYDVNGKLVNGSATIDGKTPELPQGVFDTTKKAGETRFTWQPQKDARTALVMVHYKQVKEGYIAIGRSLREIENREDNLIKIVLIGWAFTLLSVFVLLYLQKKLS